MEIQDILHGFLVKARTRVEEIGADIIKMEHIASGAQLVFIDRADDNKTFAIGFKTIPEDDTGVFHILEHTVLAGSSKYPVKDPMTALLSSSLYTYLNAFTYPDKTIYPVSSKNDKAFLDLVSVYMDAVLHPLVLKNKSIFMSEGHHLEYGEDGHFTVSGIVYNEMKGAYSSPDELMEHYISRSLYKGGTYAYDSGGFPEAIPTLTYERFLEAHKRYYHPENSVIVLDGSVNIDKTLELLNSYLKDYTRTGIDIKISTGTPDTTPLLEYYPISAEENNDNKTRVSIAYPAFSHSDYNEHIALTAIVDAISDSNSSPLKSPILASGLCENLHLYYNASLKESSLTVQFQGVKDDREAELIALFDKTIADILNKGLDKTKLLCTLNYIEFKTREADFGSFPRGMVYMLSAMEYALYGEDTSAAFNYNASFLYLREALATDYYDNLLRGILNKERVCVILKPDATLNEKDEKKQKEWLLSFERSLTEEKKTALKEELSEYDAWLSTPDSPEAMATIPALDLSDIGEATAPAPTEAYEIDGTRVIAHDIETSGILYTDMYFDVSDADKEELLTMRLLCAIISELDTENGTQDEFRSRVKSTLGDLSLSMQAVSHTEGARMYLVLRASSLISNADTMASLIREYIYLAKFNSPAKLKQRITQLYTSSHENITEDGISVALSRSASHFDDAAYLADLYNGYGYHSFLKSVAEDIEENIATLIPRLEMMRKKYTRRERLTLAITARECKNIAVKLISVIECGGKEAGPLSLERSDTLNEAIHIESTVGYSAVSASLKPFGLHQHIGSLKVLAAIISYELFWGKIRVKGGAYDTGFTVNGTTGTVSAYSYRDPAPQRSIDYFKTFVGDLRDIISDIDLTRYVISTVGITDPVTTPRTAASRATAIYLQGLDEDYTAKIRRDILATDKPLLLLLLEAVERALESSATCVAAPDKLIPKETNYNVLDI